MSRAISTDLKNHFASDVITVATCVKITLRNGSVLGFTSLPEEVTYDSQLYIPSGVLRSSPVETSEGVSSDNLDISGMIDSNLILVEDIKARLYTYAQVEIFRFNFEDQSQGKIVTFMGYIGNIRITDDSVFVAELNSLGEILNKPVGRVVGATCDVRRFGDNRCKVNKASYTVSRSVASVATAYQLTLSSEGSADDTYSYGTIKFTSGNNSGLTRDIKKHTKSGTDAIIDLKSPFPFSISPSDTVEITRGCDRTLANCALYSNQINFRGFTHIPGTTQITKVGRSA